MVSVSSIYSVLGNPNSLVPLAVKDIANSCGLTAASYMAGDKTEGKDRFIDEFGTQAIWLWGIPAYKKILDFGIKHIAKFDPNVDVRILKDEKIANLAKEFAPTDNIAKNIERSIQKASTNKALTIGKFIISTALTSVTYLGLTKFRHKYTENQIKKDYFERQKKAQENQPKTDVTFNGKLADFMFSPSKNMMILDGTITGERLTHARNPQDLMGYVIKEGSFWMFMYFANDIIRKAIEKNADKKGKSIDLDARVIENEEFKNAFKDKNSVKNAIEEFEKIENAAKYANDDSILYKYLVTNSDNLIIKVAKTSDQIKLYEEEKPWYKKLTDIFKMDNNTKELKTGKVDTREYIDLEDIKATKEKIKKLYGQCTNYKDGTDKFFQIIKKMKRGSVWTNMGACIGALGILAPAIMLLTRKTGNNTEYQVKKDIEEKLKQQLAQQ